GRREDGHHGPARDDGGLPRLPAGLRVPQLRLRRDQLRDRHLHCGSVRGLVPHTTAADGAPRGLRDAHRSDGGRLRVPAGLAAAARTARDRAADAQPVGAAAAAAPALAHHPRPAQQDLSAVSGRLPTAGSGHAPGQTDRGGAASPPGRGGALVSAAPESGLQVTRRGPVLELTIDRPHRMNALDADTVEQLVAAIAGADEQVRVIGVGGAGGAVSAGADEAGEPAGAPADAAAAGAAGEADAAATMARADSLVRAVLRAPVPVIAAVDGPAVGVAASLALACDLIYATERASFLLPFVRVGLMPDGGSSLLVAAAG